MMKRLEEQMQAAGKDPNAQAIGGMLREIGRKSPQAAELIEQDLSAPTMSLKACFDALHKYAKAHQKQGCWSCAVFDIDPENAVVKFLLDFYKIPPEWIGGGADAPETAAPAPKSAPADLFALL